MVGDDTEGSNGPVLIEENTWNGLVPGVLVYAGIIGCVALAVFVGTLMFFKVEHDGDIRPTKLDQQLDVSSISVKSRCHVPQACWSSACLPK